MKTIFIILGSLATIMVSPFTTEKKNDARSPSTEPASPQYSWKQVSPPGSGTHQHEWKPGTYPSAVVPIIGFNNDLWMIGQKQVWSSKDGVRWEAFAKHDWGERISMAEIFFNNRFWVLGGMEYATGTFLNEIWSSENGKTWTRAVKNAEWSPRKGQTVVAFKNKLWMFGGEVGVDEDKSPNKFVNDIWSSSDGIRWTKVVDEAPWEVRGRPGVLVFKNKLWLIGGQGHSDIWQSDDGKRWTKIKSEVPWKARYDYGRIVFDNLIWVFGGRESNPRKAYNDVWFSPNGVNWIQQTDRGPWTPRSGGFSVVFDERLFLYGGKHTGHEDSFSGDIWAMEKVVSGKL